MLENCLRFHFAIFHDNLRRLPALTFALIPTVLVPALLCDERLYSDVIADLGEQIEAQVLLSPKPLLADSVADILARAPAKFVLVGTSYGGRVALEIALAAPERVTALWLMGCTCGAPQTGGPDLAGGLEATPDAVFGMLAGLVVHKQATGAAATFMDMANAVGGAAGASQARAVAGQADIRARLGELKMPVLVLWGEEDAIVPASAGRKLADALPNAQFHLLPGCGHLPTLEKPVESTEIFSAFLQGTRLT